MVPMHTPSLQHLRYLQLVVAHGSFAAAGRAAGVSQSAISQSMCRLEEMWGVSLFIKQGRHKQATPHALRIIENVAEMGEVLGRMEADSLPRSVPEATTASRLSVGMAPAAALLYGPTLEKAWHAHAPDGMLRIVAQSAPDMLAALERRDLDLVIAPQPRRYRAAGIAQHPLHTSTPTVYARMGHPLADAGSLKEIMNAAWAVAGQSGTAGNVIEEALRVRGLPPPRILVQCSDYPAMVHLVADSDLLCVVPHPILLPHDDRNRIQALRLREGLPQYDVSVFWPIASRKAVAVAVSAIVSVLLQSKGAG